jgi:hypothetical protein
MKPRNTHERQGTLTNVLEHLRSASPVKNRMSSLPLATVALLALNRQIGSMASVVFFRAVNVAGHQTCQPGKLAKDLAEFDVLNIGAAGTFVVRTNVSQAKLGEEILRRLPFKPELMICPAQELIELGRGNWFDDIPGAKDAGRFVSILQKAPRVKPSLPIEEPAGKRWEVRIVALIGRFALSIRYPGKTYSNAVVEKHLGMPATTRSWNTIEKVCEALEK